MPLDLFAGIHVRDYQAARSWYERLLGREPTFLAHTTEAVWELAEHRYLFIEEDLDAPGGADIAVLVDDLDAVVAEIASRGIEPDERVTYSNGARKAIYRDVDGNEIGFGGVPPRPPESGRARRCSRPVRARSRGRSATARSNLLR